MDQFINCKATGNSVITVFIYLSVISSVCAWVAILTYKCSSVNIFA